MPSIIYRSTDTSAPVLTGATGALTALLHACLVTGYGAQLAAGWAREFFDGTTNTAVFRPAIGSRFRLRVQDNGPGAATFKEARALGYEVMTDAHTGTSPFPSVAQHANGLVIRKSTSADATARAWILAASGKMFHLFIFNADVAGAASAFSFGDINSYVPSDAASCHIIGRTTENVAGGSVETMHVLTTNLGLTTVGRYIARSYTGLGGSTIVGGHSNYFLALQASTGLGGLVFPSPVDGGMLMTPLYCHESGNARGTIPGLWNSLHNSAFIDGDTLSGVGGLSSRTFLVVSITAASTHVLLETSNTWTEN